MHSRHRALTISAVVLTAILANIFGPLIVTEYLWAYPSSTTHEFAFVYLLGMLIAEGVLLGNWAALGSQPISIRVPLVGFLGVACICSFIVGLEIVDPSLPFEIAVLFGSAGVLFLFAIQVPLISMRLHGNHRIDVPGKSVKSQQEAMQFGLKHLLLWITVVAVVLLLVRAVLPSLENRVHIVDELGIAVAMLAGFAGLSAVVTSPCTWIVLCPNSSRKAIVTLAVTAFTAPLALTGLLTPILRTTRSFDVEFVMGVYGFELGLVATTIAVLLLVRILGYRLVNSRTKAGDTGGG